MRRWSDSALHAHVDDGRCAVRFLVWYRLRLVRGWVDDLAGNSDWHVVLGLVDDD